MCNVETQETLISKLHELYSKTLIALQEKRTYDIYVLMSERSRYVLKWVELNQDVDSNFTHDIYQETEELQGLISVAIESLTQTITNIMQTTLARKAYASSFAIGEVANHLLRHRED